MHIYPEKGKESFSGKEEGHQDDERDEGHFEGADLGAFAAQVDDDGQGTCDVDDGEQHDEGADNLFETETHNGCCFYAAERGDGFCAAKIQYFSLYLQDVRQSAYAEQRVAFGATAIFLAVERNARAAEYKQPVGDTA